MEILKVERVIDHLIQGGTVELLGSDLKFQDKNDTANQDEIVGPFAHPRDRKLKSDPARC